MSGGREPSSESDADGPVMESLGRMYHDFEQDYARAAFWWRLAEVNVRTCLPHAGREACQLCVDECATAGYDAIEFVRVGTETDPFGQPIENSGFLAPVVLPEKCVGCGLCQTRCYAINAKAKGLLEHSAIEVRAGQGKEDRLASGSYAALRKEEERLRKEQQRKLSKESGVDDSYLPDFLK
ncbi:MAG: hypothetical protein ABIP48_18335 [Planctomycetota bacterium]